MSRSAEVGVAEAHDGGILVTVSGTIGIRTLLIHSVYVVGDGVCIGTELYPAEGSTGSGKDVPHPVGPYQGIDIIRRLLGRGGQICAQKSSQRKAGCDKAHAATYPLENVAGRGRRVPPVEK